MLAICPICVSKFVSKTDDITALQCGHTFHYACVLQWIQTSKTCPQCRKKTTERNLIKLFFDTQLDSTQEDIGLIQNNNDCLQFQITLKNKEIKNAKENNEKMEKQVIAIKGECSKLNKELKKNNLLVSNYKMQIIYLNDDVKEIESVKKKAQKAESELKTLGLMKKIYSERYADIESIISDCSAGSNMEENLINLATISSIMQKKLNDTSKEKAKFAEESIMIKRKLKESEKILLEREMQIEVLQKKLRLLKEDVNSLEFENSNLSKKISALEETIISPSGGIKNKIIKRLLAENVVPENFKKLKNSEQVISETFITPEVIRTKQQEPIKSNKQQDKIEEKECPYIRLKSTSVNPFATLNNRNPQCLNKKAAKSSIIDKSKFFQFSHPSSSEDFGYDGMGGHHKVDEFPKYNPMIKKIKNVNIVQKRKINSAKVVSVQKINDYFKNTFEE